ncbi:MAG: metalloregulator ArsR/SmtB family transcription factor [Marinilabiliales bacterium]
MKMTYAKNDLFEDELQEISSFFKVLSHPARIKILKYLAEKKQCISGDITDFIPLGRTTVSRHLQELKTAGLIKGKISGKNVNYCLCDTTIKRFSHLVDELLTTINIGEIKC